MFVTPDGFNGVSPFQEGNDPAVDSDANPDNGLMSDVVTLTSGEIDDTIDAGFFQLFADINLEKFTRVDANPIQLTKLVAVEPIDGGLIGQDLCDDALGLGKPEALIFEYIPGNTVDTDQDPSKAVILSNNGVDDDGTSFIVVSDEDDANKALDGDGKQFFRGNVDFGELFEANDNTDSFGSKTFIHFFDNANGGLLQTIEYHTSCSQPIQLGDVIGNATLFGYDGEDAPLVTIPQPEFVDANEVPGPETLVGTTVEFRYEVRNTGDSEISNVMLTDDRIADITFVEGDTDGDGNLDTNETWIYTASEVATGGLVTNKGTVTGVVNGNTTVAFDTANYTGIGGGGSPGPYPPTGHIGGIDLGDLTKYLFFFANGSQDANWQAATKGFAGDVVVDGIQAHERTSGHVSYGGTIYTNASTLGAWQDIVHDNPGQANAVTGQTALVADLEADLNSAFSQINALTATSGFSNRSSTSL